MNKNLLKIGALALGMFACGAILMGTSNAQETGQVSLTINTGTTTCEYGNSLTFTAQNVNFDAAYVFESAFLTTWGNDEWYCQDYDAIDTQWSLNISMSGDLSNGLGSTISKTGVQLKYVANPTVGATECVTTDATTYVSLGTAHTIFSKPDNVDKVCRVSLTGAMLKVDVPANQAPGTYVGTLVIDLPF